MTDKIEQLEADLLELHHAGCEESERADRLQDRLSKLTQKLRDLVVYWETESARHQIHVFYNDCFSIDEFTDDLDRLIKESETAGE